MGIILCERLTLSLGRIDTTMQATFGRLEWGVGNIESWIRIRRCWIWRRCHLEGMRKWSERWIVNRLGRRDLYFSTITVTTINLYSYNQRD